MELFKALKTRRSVRLYSDKEIELSELNSIIEAATWAPTAGNAQPWFFIIVTKHQGLEDISNFSPGIISKPKAAIVACIDISRINKEDITNEDITVSIIDLAMACENIILAALDYNLGTCPVRSFNRVAISELLELPVNIVPQLIITIGYPKNQPKAPKKLDFNQVINYERYGVKSCER